MAKAQEKPLLCGVFPRPIFLEILEDARKLIDFW